MIELFELVKKGYGHVYEVWSHKDRVFENVSLFSKVYHRVYEGGTFLYVQRGEDYLWTGYTKLT